MKTDKFLDTYFYIAGWVIIALLGLGVLALKVSGLTLSEVVPPCTLNAITGYYCPGCGGTRAAVALLRGKVLRSVFYHPIVLYAAVFGGWFMISQSIERLSRHRIQIGMHYRNIYLWIALVIVVLNCLVKNLAIALWGVSLMG